MLNLQKLLLLGLVFTLTTVEEISGQQRYLIKDFYSDEAKEIIRELNKYIQNTFTELKMFGNELIQQQNKVFGDLEEVRRLIKISTMNSCYQPLTVPDGKEALDSFLQKCYTSSAEDRMLIFSDELISTKAKVKLVDNILRENDETCESEPSSCEETKHKSLNELKHILSDELKVSYEKEANLALNDAKKNIQKCFSEKVKELLDDLQWIINRFNKCLSKLS